jgi:ubiquitin carboxyl-terminal hydrolase 1
MSTKSGSFSALENVKANTNGIESPSSMTSSRKKRGKEVKKVEIRLKEMLDSNTVTNFGESLLAPMGGNGPIPVKWQTVRTDSIREAAITRAPQSLRLHFIRSEYTPYGQLLKKNARVNFPLILDLTRFVANGVWEERNIMGMLSTPKSATDGDGNPSPSVESQAPQPRVLYRLESVILHYGYTHSSGHYICIRRKPAPKLGRATTTAIDNDDDDDNHHRPTAITKSCPDGCRCDDCCWYGQVRSSGKEERGKGWLRISDADVDEVGIEALIEARSAVFMVFYEKVGEYVGDKVVNRGYTVNGSVKDIEKGSEGDSRESSVSVE